MTRKFKFDDAPGIEFEIVNPKNGSPGQKATGIMAQFTMDLWVKNLQVARFRGLQIIRSKGPKTVYFIGSPGKPWINQQGRKVWTHAVQFFGRVMDREIQSKFTKVVIEELKLAIKAAQEAIPEPDMEAEMDLQPDISPAQAVASQADPFESLDQP